MLVIFFVFLLVSQVYTQNLRACSRANRIKVKELSLQTMYPGKSANARVVITAEGVTPDLDMVMEMPFCKFVPCSMKLTCSDFSGAGLPCQLSSGHEYSITKTLNVPFAAILLKGIHNIKVKLSKNGQEFGCFEFYAQIR
ncbi:uncharacterized protein LOC100215554 isoform X1 [Hydra vulgaris]|uniref:uncharacterized protein LOC100215554 isoform X1 n=1 Tax=Hydra vulgaris TaxID=6087 RepID=UPI00064127D9|nr:uncharacterized protein LOC100215554 [Hydra vulgaris]